MIDLYFLVYAVVAAFLFGLGLALGNAAHMPVSMIAIIAITWPAIAIYTISNLVFGYVAGFCWALWQLARGRRP